MISKTTILFEKYLERYTGYRAGDLVQYTYYYFGADNFEKAEKNLISWIDKQQEVINPERLCKQIDKELSFVQDAHFSTSNTWYNSVNDRFYYYYYSHKNVFVKEGSKYTTKINGKKYTFKSFNKKDVELKKNNTE